ncbi:hypothetical protein GQ42DRAFT_115500, partial [Ramicandelaber brevisporus]
SADGRRVGVLHLPTQFFTTGSLIEGVIDLGCGQVPCFHISIWLESFEQPAAIKPTTRTTSPRASISIAELAVRSRQVHAEHHESCRFVHKLAFMLPVPIDAVSEF